MNFVLCATIKRNYTNYAEHLYLLLFIILLFIIVYSKQLVPSTYICTYGEVYQNMGIMGWGMDIL